MKKLKAYLAEDTDECLCLGIFAYSWQQAKEFMRSTEFAEGCDSWMDFNKFLNKDWLRLKSLRTKAPEFAVPGVSRGGADDERMLEMGFYAYIDERFSCGICGKDSGTKYYNDVQKKFCCVKCLP